MSMPLPPPSWLTRDGVALLELVALVEDVVAMVVRTAAAVRR